MKLKKINCIRILGTKSMYNYLNKNIKIIHICIIEKMKI